MSYQSIVALATDRSGGKTVKYILPKAGAHSSFIMADDSVVNISDMEWETIRAPTQEEEFFLAKETVRASSVGDARRSEKLKADIAAAKERKESLQPFAMAPKQRVI